MSCPSQSEAIRLAYGDMSFLSSLRAVASPAGYIVSTIVLIILYVAFLSSSGNHAQKFALLFPDPNRSERVSGVLALIIRSVHRYLFVKTIISIGTGLAACVVMRLVGGSSSSRRSSSPSSSNFIPNVGSILATILPSLMAVVGVQFVRLGIFTIGSVGLVQFIGGNAIDGRHGPHPPT